MNAPKIHMSTILLFAGATLSSMGVYYSPMEPYQKFLSMGFSFSLASLFRYMAEDIRRDRY